MLQASLLDGLVLDPFAFGEDGLPAAEVDVGGREIAEALVRSDMVVQQGLSMPSEPSSDRFYIGIMRPVRGPC